LEKVIQDGKGCCHIQLEVHPGASSCTIEPPNKWRDRLVVRVVSPAKMGAANNEVVEILARALELPRSQISITSGSRSRRKTMKVEGISANEVKGRIEKAIYEIDPNVVGN